MRSLPLLDLEERQMAEVISGDDLWSPAKAQQNALSSQWSVAIGKPASRSKP
jgi:hypothetical protein